MHMALAAQHCQRWLINWCVKCIACLLQSFRQLPMLWCNAGLICIAASIRCRSLACGRAAPLWKQRSLLLLCAVRKMSIPFV